MFYRFFHGCTVSLIPALIADCADYEKNKNETPVPVTIGIINIAPKIASLLRSLLIPAVLALVGFDETILPADATHSFKVGILNMFMTIPGCISIAAGLILLIFYQVKVKDNGLGGAKEI